MSENLKKFLEAVSANEELNKKASAAPKEELLAMAKELGIELTEDDLKQESKELSDDELDAVAGGGTCACVLGGGGKKAGDGSVYDVCACVVAGTGLKKLTQTVYDPVMGEWRTETHNVARCVCVTAGAGKDK